MSPARQFLSDFFLWSVIAQAQSFVSLLSAVFGPALSSGVGFIGSVCVLLVHLNSLRQGQEVRPVTEGGATSDLEKLFSEAQDMMCVASTEGYFEKMNPAFQRILGFSDRELRTQPILSFVVPEDHEKTIAQFSGLASGKPTVYFENRYRAKDGSLIYLAWNASPLGNKIFACARDMTAQKKAEQLLLDQQKLLIHSAKMASLGEMAGGVAHEINTPLNIIVVASDLLRMQIESPAVDVLSLRKHIDLIEMTTMRIAKIVNGLRTFARDGAEDPLEDQSALTICEDTIAFCKERFQFSGVKIELRVPENLTLHCRSVQISQVLLNLLNNSFDAIRSSPEKWVKVEAVLRGDRVQLSVTDSGKGIPPALAAKIMQPFFTTKAVGAGTGLGLSIAKGLVEAHVGGRLFYDANSPHTRFVIELHAEPVELPLKFNSAG